MGSIVEKASAFKTEIAVNSQTLTSSDVNGAVIDLQGFNSVFFVVNVGANGGTLDGSNNVTFVLQEGDLSNGSDMADVTSTNLTGGFAIDANGVFATVDAGGEAETAYKVAYTGIKRYVRLQADVTGTISLPVGATALKGDGFKPQS